MSIDQAELNLDAETTEPLVRVRRRRRRVRDNAGADLIQIMRETMRDVLYGRQPAAVVMKGGQGEEVSYED